MIDILTHIGRSGIVERGCFVQGKELLASTFTEEHKKYENIARQAFNYVFLNVAKSGAKHKEAHLEIGEKRLSAFVVGKNLLLICMSSKGESVLKVREQARNALIELRRIQAKSGS